MTHLQHFQPSALSYNIAASQFIPRYFSIVKQKVKLTDDINTFKIPLFLFLFLNMPRQSVGWNISE